MDNPEFEESEYEEHTPMEFTVNDNNRDASIDFSLAPVNVQEEYENVIRLRDNIINEKTLNKKQEKAFKLATENILKRRFKEDTDQLIAYVGGPGGTGKSQVIKAIIEFHEQLKIRHTLKLCANTGTAAKHIEGSTTTTLFGLSSKDKIDAKKLQKNFYRVLSLE